MENFRYRLLLADDDIDDCFFFREALEELPFTSKLSTVNDGVELMRFLTGNLNDLPDMLFLDLNMPRKTGYECLSEIKQHATLRHLPVIIISTSFEHDVVNLLYKNGADFYLRKPGDFSVLKKHINHAIRMVSCLEKTPKSEQNFVINSNHSSLFSY
jgi:CheY-like chemotaxis protein